jgi:hypothetical protein
LIITWNGRDEKSIYSFLIFGSFHAKNKYRFPHGEAPRPQGGAFCSIFAIKEEEI